MEDCESSVTMRVRCRRVHLIAALPILILFSVLLNITMLRRHWYELSYGGLFGSSGTKMSPEGRNRAAVKRKSRRHDISPIPGSLSQNATFSACLLIKDDNEILNEWLAYHYFVLNLRHLVVAIDPLSSESPSDILRKWSNLTDLAVLEWTDDDYMPHDFLEKGHPPRKDMQKASDFRGILSATDLLEISNHRYRQRVFLAQCMKKHRQLGHSWVIHIDTDEYVVASKLLRQMKPDYLVIPSLDQPGSVLSLLQQAVAKTHALLNYPCISMLRVIFGSVESRREYRDHLVPEEFNSTAFETLRWRYHGLPHNMSIHGNPKVILDVAAIPESHMPDVVFSIHRPVTSFCSRNSDLMFTSFRRQPIAVNHYLGSWERYSGRQDKRRSRDKYEAKANQRRGMDDGVRPWLKGFVETMGQPMAQTLLGEAYMTKALPTRKRHGNATLFLPKTILEGVRLNLTLTATH